VSAQPVAARLRAQRARSMKSDISRLLEKSRDAELAPEAWPDLFNSLINTLGVAGAACIISSKSTGRVDWICFSGLSAEFQPDYVNHYASLDPFSPLLNVDAGWVRLSESLPDTFLRQSEWYNDSCCVVAFVIFLGLVSWRRRPVSQRSAYTSSLDAALRTRQRRSSKSWQDPCA
jgi:hypothetical protein